MGIQIHTVLLSAFPKCLFSHFPLFFIDDNSAGAVADRQFAPNMEWL